MNSSTPKNDKQSPPTIFDQTNQSSGYYQVQKSYPTPTTISNNVLTQSSKNISAKKAIAKSQSYSKLANTLSNINPGEAEKGQTANTSLGELKFQKINSMSIEKQARSMVSVNDIYKNNSSKDIERKQLYSSMSNISNLFKYEKSFKADPDQFFNLKQDILPYTSSPLITLKQLEELKFVRQGAPNNFYMQMLRLTQQEKRNPKYETNISNILQRQSQYQQHMNQSIPKLAQPLQNIRTEGSLNNNKNNDSNITNKKISNKSKLINKLITDNGQDINISPNVEDKNAFNVEKQIKYHQSQNITQQKTNERSDIIHLARWLDEMLIELKKQNNWNFKEFYESMEMIYTGCISEIVRQISIDCYDRGQLLEKIWLSYLKTVKEFFEQMQKSTMGVEMEGLVENKRLHTMYARELDKVFVQVESLNEKVEMRDIYMGKVKNENRYFKKKIKRLDKFITVLNSDFNEQIKKYEFAQEEIKQLKLERSELEQKISELEQKMDYMENQQLQISSAEEGQQQQQNFNLTLNYFGDIENIRQQLKQQFQEIFEEEKKKIIESYQVLEDQKKKLQLAKEQVDIEDNFEYIDEKGEQHIIEEIEEFTLENKETDTQGLCYSQNQACDTEGLLKKMDFQIQTERFFNSNNKGVQASVKQETRSTQVSLNLIMSGSRSMRLELLKKIQKGLKAYLEEIGGFNFPLNLAAELNVSTMDIMYQQIELMKLKIKDALLGLLIKEDVNNQDFEAVSNYLEVNYDSVYQLVNVIWTNIDKLFKKGVDFKIEAIEKGLDESIASDQLNKSQSAFKKLYEQYKIIKNNQSNSGVQAIQPNIKINNPSQLAKPKRSVISEQILPIQPQQEKTALGVLQKAGKKILNASMLFKGSKSPGGQANNPEGQSTNQKQQLQSQQQSQPNLLTASTTKILDTSFNANNTSNQNEKNLIIPSSTNIIVNQMQPPAGSSQQLSSNEEDQEIENIMNQRKQKQILEESKIKNQHSKQQSQLSSITLSDPNQDQDEANMFIKERKEESEEDKDEVQQNKLKERHKSLQQLEQIILDGQDKSTQQIQISQIKKRKSLPDAYKYSYYIHKHTQKVTSKRHIATVAASQIQKRGKRVSVMFTLPKELIPQIVNMGKDYQKQIEQETKLQEQKLNIISQQNDDSNDNANQDQMQQFLLVMNMTAQPIQSINARFRTHKSVNNYTAQATEQLQKSLDEYKKKINVIYFQFNTFLKLNSQLFTEILKMLAFNESSKPPLFYISLYEFIIATFGLTLSAMKKYQKFIVSCFHYCNQSKRAEMYSKFISGYYDHVDYQFILETIQLLDDSNQKGISIMQSQDDHILVSYNKAVEVLYNQFNDSYERKKLVQVERGLHNKVVKFQNKLLIDFDIVIEQYMQLFKEVRNKMNNVYKDIFYAVDLDMINIIYYEDFLLLMRHIEAYRFNLNKTNMHKLFQLECDYQIDKKKVMSIQRFSSLCIDNDLFSYGIQEQFLKGDGEYGLEKMKPEWFENRRNIKLRLIKSDHYNIKMRKLITKIDNFMEGDKKFARRNYFIYLLLEAESKRILAEYFARELMPEKLNIIHSVLEEVINNKKMKI